MLAGHTIQAPGGGGELSSAKLNGVNYFWLERRSGMWDKVYGLHGTTYGFCPHGDTRLFSSVYNSRDSIG